MMAMIGNSISPFFGNLAGPLVASILQYLKYDSLVFS